MAPPAGGVAGDVDANLPHLFRLPADTRPLPSLAAYDALPRHHRHSTAGSGGRRSRPGDPAAGDRGVLAVLGVGAVAAPRRWQSAGGVSGRR
ncbi:hypothetical protein [Streptomyces sp. R41]|uniref:Uncharacterized protein n=1 Tax=Streptomyces sp. R41 TaxID=3238632 RepID=A0AB39R8H6_9ACTN